ncbi:MAG: hypothetical protein OXC56_00090 [Chloroflexi bacterium]|nr:hypothetical protein [Chloroflexota bacterium]
MNHASPSPAPTLEPPEVRPRLAREDALPEHVDYRDSGCDLFPSCLSCPLPRCRYDEPGGVRAMLNRTRDREIRRMRLDDQVPVNEIARRFHVSRRTVFRALEGAHREPAPRVVSAPRSTKEMPR